MLVFYLRAISWAAFIAEVGFTKVDYDENYDIALSFAGEDRVYAQHLADVLTDSSHAVFYDEYEQSKILGTDVEAYLTPIYEAASRYVVVVLGEHYGRKRWTLFESSRFKPRIEKGQVIPIWSTKIPPSPFDEIRGTGGLVYDPDKDLLMQAQEAAATISKRLSED